MQDALQIPLNDIEQKVHRALIAHGALNEIAAEVAKAVRVAESRGNKICGLQYVESYCLQLLSGRVKGDVEPVVSQPRNGVVQVDAQLGFAQVAFKRGLPLALQAARENGTAQLAIGHAHTCTSLGYFTEQIAREGLIAIGLTNASPIVAPPNGKKRVLGTNPIAFSVPDGKGGLAMQFDQSTTTVALGKIKMAKAAGEAIPESWAVDVNGAPTTDAAAALGGSLVSSGGYKGWGFGLMAEVLAAGMTSSTLSKDVAPLLLPDGTPHNLGQFYMLLDPVVSKDFHARMTELAEAVAADEGARLPGRNKKDIAVVDVIDTLWDKIIRLSER